MPTLFRQLLRFPLNVILVEASWTTWEHGVATGPIVYGSEGTLVFDANAADAAVRVHRSYGETVSIRPDALPADRNNIRRLN